MVYGLGFRVHEHRSATTSEAGPAFIRAERAICTIWSYAAVHLARAQGPPCAARATSSAACSTPMVCSQFTATIWQYIPKVIHP
jgi:hypothetical protein